MGQSCSTKNKARGSANVGSPRPLRMPGQPSIVESFELDSPRVAFTVPGPPPPPPKPRSPKLVVELHKAAEAVPQQDLTRWAAEPVAKAAAAKATTDPADLPAEISPLACRLAFAVCDFAAIDADEISLVQHEFVDIVEVAGRPTPAGWVRCRKRARGASLSALEPSGLVPWSHVISAVHVELHALKGAPPLDVPTSSLGAGGGVL